MDILISSNLERLIYNIAGNDSTKNAELMTELSREGKYSVSDEMMKNTADFIGGYATESETAEFIKSLYDKTGYVIDTHTAVAGKVYADYKNNTGDESVTVIASTASPYKFGRSVLVSIDPAYDSMTDFELIDKLKEISVTEIPQAIEDIRTAPVRHNTVVETADMQKEVERYLGIK